MKTGAAVLLSGGLDSAVLLEYMSQRHDVVHPLYIRSGLAWEPTEQYWVGRFLDHLDNDRIRPLMVLELPVSELYGAHWSVTGNRVPDADTPDEAVYLPGRNLLLISKAAVYCSLKQLQVLALAPLNRNPFPDSTPEFFRSYEQLVWRALSHRLSIETPFLNRSKEEVIQLGAELPLELTFSCIAPVGIHHCGRCNKCSERRQAFLRAGVEDRTEYTQPVSSNQ